jgi:hypothetical protein
MKILIIEAEKTYFGPALKTGESFGPGRIRSQLPGTRDGSRSSVRCVRVVRKV